ncbi:uncharacterized protein LOC142977239 [Anticarsia gemmatalis]|uniref:uncharacterized protein LOC142977239 n=1 Tax=Anticarsia gemmatalis TaxID=129554 RepID=UPI003F776DDD
MFFIKRNPNIKPIKTLVRFYSYGRKNHYEILNLRKNCSDKDIKEAFIRLSKEYHPDKNKDAKAQEKFVNIVEAYNVLSKPGSRARYDDMTVIHNNSYVYRTHVPYNLRKNAQYSYYYASQAKTNANENTNTDFGTSGMRRFPNYVIIAVCAGVAFVGVLIQVFVIRNLYVAQRKQAQEKSMRLAEELDKVRAAALANGNELQTRLLMDKIVNASNSTVATASLGQALANEKKDSETFYVEFGLPEDTVEEYSYVDSTKEIKMSVYRAIKRIMTILCQH